MEGMEMETETLNTQANDKRAVDAWQGAEARFEAANADLEALGPDFSDLENDFYTEAREYALHHLITLPAPHTGAIQRKIQLIEQNELWLAGQETTNQLFQALFADIGRFACRLLAAESQLLPEQKERASEMLQRMLVSDRRTLN
jgi:hypothetical protein